MEEPLLDVQNLAITLPSDADRRHAVSDLNFTLRRGETLCVIGESGSGKSLTGRAILQLLPKPHVRLSQGRILFEGTDLVQLGEAGMRKIRGNSISMIFQEPMTALNPVLSIGRQIDEVLIAHTSLSRTERGRRMREILAETNLVDPDRILRSYPHQLSGGQRQRAMIAMALILEPKLIIADEPTTALDVTTQAQILRLMKQIQERHRAGLLFITHDFGVVAEIADRVIVMERGRAVESGPAKEVLHAPSHPYTKSLMAAVPSLTPRIRDGQTALEPTTLLAVDSLSKAYLLPGGRSIKAVDNVSLRLGVGETLGIVGESGSGKSSLARLLLRLSEPDEGSIRLDDVDLLALNRSQLRDKRHLFQVVFQDPYGSLNPRWNVGRIIGEGLRLRKEPERKVQEKSEAIIELVGLDRRALSRFPHEFSGGQRQRIAIARALIMDPKLLIADEAVSALDVSIQAQILKLLDNIKRRLNLSMIFITHDLRVAANICDTVMVMQSGRVVEAGPVEIIFRAPQQEYTQNLFAAVPGRLETD
ncbi:ABC transporter ATP-binding protein [Bradyrhizobium mercantei]|uniref:ABC transporter ATP-binding protein n=1 Tax=Bradyrhizobium mercantei TaxID=1904807 RepID=UPI0009759CC7|nr:ABC transporter ATP-binding protein [Bradyrhizobium mercantei]